MTRCSSSTSAGAQILPDRRHAAAQPDVAAARRVPRLLERGVDAVGDEPELRAALHRERRARVMRQHEDGRVIRGLVTPPALPALVRPRAADGTEHVAPEDPGADPVEALRRQVVVHARLAVFVAVHPLPGARVEEPVEHLRAADSERVLEILARPGAEPVDGDREAWTRSLDMAFLPGCSRRLDGRIRFLDGAPTGRAPRGLGTSLPSTELRGGHGQHALCFVAPHEGRPHD